MATISSSLLTTNLSGITSTPKTAISNMNATRAMSDVTSQSWNMYSSNHVVSTPYAETSDIWTFNFTEEFIIVCNMTLDLEPGEFVLHDYALRVVLATFVVAILVLGIFGNALVILAVALSRRLQNATNVFVVNLAVADLVTNLFLPIHVATLLHPNSCRIPDLLCKFIAAATLTTIGCSIVTLALIAFYRYKLMRRIPTTNPNIGNEHRHLVLMVAFSWLYPIFLMCVIVPAGVGSLGYSHQYKVCTQITDRENSDYLTLAVALFCQFPAFVVIVVCYVLILKEVRRHHRGMMKRATPSAAAESTGRSEINTAVTIEDSTTTPSPPPRHPEPPSPARFDQWSAEPGVMTLQRLQEENRRKQYKQQLRITVNLFIVVCAYTICVMPAAIAFLIPPSDPVIPWFTLLFLCNFCVNPMVYALKHPNFSNVFACILKCRFDDIPEPSPLACSCRLFPKKSTYSPRNSP